VCGKHCAGENLTRESVAVGRCENVARFVIPEDKARAGIPGGKHRQALPGDLKVLEAFQPQVPAIRILDHNIVGGLKNRNNWYSQGAIPPAG
jgi:hypothetical protein